MKIYCSFLFLLLLNFNINGQVNFDSQLLGFWPFNGNMNDESQFSNDGINNGSILAANSIFNINAGYEFNGSSSFIEIPYSYTELTLPFSVSAWINKTNFNDHEHIFTSSSNLNNYYGIYLSINPSGQVQISYCDGGIAGIGSRRTKNSNASIPLNEWVHITVVVNGPNDMIIQINEDIVDGFYSGNGGTLQNGMNNALIGRAMHNPDYWSGSIDDVRLYNRALTTDELAVICDELQQEQQLAAIPTLGEWGLISLSIVFIILGVIGIREKTRIAFNLN